MQTSNQWFLTGHLETSLWLWVGHLAQYLRDHLPRLWPIFFLEAQAIMFPLLPPDFSTWLCLWMCHLLLSLCPLSSHMLNQKPAISHSCPSLGNWSVLPIFCPPYVWNPYLFPHLYHHFPFPWAGYLIPLLYLSNPSAPRCPSSPLIQSLPCT